MKNPSSGSNLRDEIKREFQLERMILFSDAVFAISMTLMAMEIKLPKTEGGLTAEMLPKAVQQLLPVVISYSVSFMFIGAIWYEHLKIFSLLKDYNKGLVVRNLLLLFFIGFFPFSASLITQVQGGFIAFFIYLLIIMLCMAAQYLLYHYIIITKPEIALNIDREIHVLELRTRKISLIGFFIAAILATITYMIFSNPIIKSLSSMWIVFYAVIYAIVIKNLKRKEVEKLESNDENS